MFSPIVYDTTIKAFLTRTLPPSMEELELEEVNHFEKLYRVLFMRDPESTDLVLLDMVCKLRASHGSL